MDDQELLDIVDEKDNVIGQNTKENKFRGGLISRNVAVFILDKNKNLLITKRAPNKKSFPNRYDLAACGNVKSGENYNGAAKREVLEELGIKCNLRFLGKILNEFEENGLVMKYFTGIFLGHFSGEIKLNEELVELKKLSAKEVGELIDKNKDLFTRGFVRDFVFAKKFLT